MIGFWILVGGSAFFSITLLRITLTHRAKTRRLARFALQNAEDEKIFQSQTTEERRIANLRAANLLRSLLNPDQLQDLNTSGYFSITGKSGRKYRVSSSGGVSGFCVYSSRTVPPADSAVTMKMWIEGDERRFRKTAYRTRGY